MRFGTYAEQFVAEEYTAQTGNAVQRFTPMLRHPTAPLIGHVDRLVIPEGQKRAAHQRQIRTDRLLEAKTANAFAAFNAEEWGPAGTDAVPAAYLVQVATYRILTGCRYADLAVLFGNQELRVYHLERDVELEEMILARASEWWANHVLADVAPAPVCDSDLRLLYPRSAPLKAVEADYITQVAIEDLRRLRNMIKGLEKDEAALAVSVKAYMEDAEALIVGDRTLATWKSSAATRKTDWKAVATALAASKELVELFTTEAAGSRRFLVKDEK
jgi:predicted phage-related endonuclease